MSRKKKFNTKYSAEFKIAVIMDMRENHLSYRETARKYKIGLNESQGKDRLRGWERIYLEEGAAGLMTERRGRKSTGRPRTPYSLHFNFQRIFAIAADIKSYFRICRFIYIQITLRNSKLYHLLGL